jgi:serine protease Do
MSMSRCLTLLGGLSLVAPNVAAAQVASPPPAAASLPDVAERAVKSVVNISTTRVRRFDPNRGAPFDDPLFRHFFGPGPQQPPAEQRENSLGSGVVVSADGLVLTNNHVVEGAEDIIVTFAGGRDVHAEIAGTDPRSDVAVLRLKEKVPGLQPLPMGDSDTLRLAETVLAIGNPFGLGHTVTSGILSARGRNALGIVDYEDFLQTDAAINPGNSGGALVNTRGELVGINTAIASRTGGYQGVGFAIPVNMARHIMESLLKEGRVRRGWLGVGIQDLTADLAQGLKIDVTQGAVVSDVMRDSPAGRAGLRRGDVIVRMGREPIESSSELRNVVAMQRPGAKVDVEIVRDGKRQTLNVTLGELEEAAGPAARPGPARSGGLELGELTPDIRARQRVPDDVKGGAVVRNVAPGSPAAAAGLRPGDVVIEADRKPVSGPDDVRRALAGGKTVLLVVVREGSSRFVVIEPSR